jgi:hypothetical protein
LDWASDKVQRGRAAAGLGNVPPPRRPNITGRDARRTRRRGRPRYFVISPNLAAAEQKWWIAKFPKTRELIFSDIQAKARFMQIN